MKLNSLPKVIKLGVDTVKIRSEVFLTPKALSKQEATLWIRLVDNWLCHHQVSLIVGLLM